MTGEHWDTEGRNWDTEGKSSSWGFTLTQPRLPCPAPPFSARLRQEGKPLCLASPGGPTASPKHPCHSHWANSQERRDKAAKGPFKLLKNRKRKEKSEARSWAGLQSSRAGPQHRTNCRDTVGPEHCVTQLPPPGPGTTEPLCPPIPNPTGDPSSVP